MVQSGVALVSEENPTVFFFPETSATSQFAYKSVVVASLGVEVDPRGGEILGPKPSGSTEHASVWPALPAC
jgi:hypothetical protein